MVGSMQLRSSHKTCRSGRCRHPLSHEPSTSSRDWPASAGVMGSPTIPLYITPQGSPQLAFIGLIQLAFNKLRGKPKGCSMQAGEVDGEPISRNYDYYSLAMEVYALLGQRMHGSHSPVEDIVLPTQGLLYRDLNIMTNMLVRYS